MKDAVFLYIAVHGDDNVANPAFGWLSFLGGLALFVIGIGFLGGWILFRDRKRNYVGPRFKSARRRKQERRPKLIHPYAQTPGALPGVCLFCSSRYSMRASFNLLDILVSLEAAFKAVLRRLTFCLVKASISSYMAWINVRASGGKPPWIPPLEYALSMLPSCRSC